MDSDAVRAQWQALTGAYSPDYYAYYGADVASEAIFDHLERWCDRDASVLELGCSAGRHLAYLHDRGYSDLSGIDINDDALAVLYQAYPDLGVNGTFRCAAIESVIGEFSDQAFDVVFTVETIQHLHPDSDWVFEEIARITGELLITIEIEGGPDDTSVAYVDEDVPLYHRDWGAIFTEFGFEEVETTAFRSDTLRAFRPRTGDPADERP